MTWFARFRRRRPVPVALVQCIGGPMDGVWIPDGMGANEFPDGSYVRETRRHDAPLSQEGLDSLLLLTGDRAFRDELTVYRFQHRALTNPEPL